MVTPVLADAVVRAVALMGVFLDIIVIVALVVILLVKEGGSAAVRGERRHPRLEFLVSAVNAPILSLLTIFVLIVVSRVLELL